MKNKLTVYELGKVLKSISQKYSINILLKRKLSGGFITVVGDVSVEYIPSKEKALKGNNIIGLKVKNNENGVIDIKITGIKESTFNVDLAPTKYKEVKLQGISIDKVKESNEECKMKIDEDLIFTIKAPYNEVETQILNEITKENIL